MKKILMFFGIFVTCAALAEGFPSGTIVHCPFEDVPIEYIKPGTPVFSFDAEGNHCIERVLKIFEKDTDTLIRLQAEGENFFAAPDQLFLLSDNTWHAAIDLQVGDGLRRVGGVSSVIDLEIIDVSGTNVQLYTLFISGTQNFSITKSGFYVHNVVPLIIIAGGVAAKTTLVVVLEAAAEVAAVAGIGYGGAYLHSKYKEKQRQARGANSSQPTCGGGGGRPPDDPNDPWWKNVFKSAPKPDNKEVQRQVRQLQKSRRSLEKVAKEHMEKLAAYKKNPYACDNLGHLKNAATPERAENIIRTRIRLLTGEIAGFEKDIIQIDRDLADLGSP